MTAAALSGEPVRFRFMAVGDGACATPEPDPERTNL
ncbi:phage tail protein, partial [Klebsiella pneumoniae]|nr:phage tail protein [Klebsiella pneumoniae]